MQRVQACWTSISERNNHAAVPMLLEYGRLLLESPCSPCCLEDGKADTALRRWFGSAFTAYSIWAVHFVTLGQGSRAMRDLTPVCPCQTPLCVDATTVITCIGVKAQWYATTTRTMHVHSAMQALAGMLPSPLMHSDDMLDVVVVPYVLCDRLRCSVRPLPSKEKNKCDAIRTIPKS
jgi:hypothetical protein